MPTAAALGMLASLVSWYNHTLLVELHNCRRIAAEPGLPAAWNHRLPVGAFRRAEGFPVADSGPRCAAAVAATEATYNSSVRSADGAVDDMDAEFYACLDEELSRLNVLLAFWNAALAAERADLAVEQVLRQAVVRVRASVRLAKLQLRLLAATSAATSELSSFSSSSPTVGSSTAFAIDGASPSTEAPRSQPITPLLPPARTAAVRNVLVRRRRIVTMAAATHEVVRAQLRTFEKLTARHTDTS